MQIARGDRFARGAVTGRSTALILAFVGLAAGAAAPAWAGTFTGLGQLPDGPQSSFAGPVISGNGSVVTGAYGPIPFRWTAADGLAALPSTPLKETGRPFGEGTAVLADGSAIFGMSRGDVDERGVRWSNTAPGQTPTPPTIEGGALPSGFRTSYILDSNPTGSVLVGEGFDEAEDGSVAVRWVDGIIEPLPNPGGTPGQPPYLRSSAYAVSDDGSVIAGRIKERGKVNTVPFRWTEAGGYQFLPSRKLAGNGQAEDMSADGSIIIGYGQTNEGSEAFSWTEAGGMVSLGDLEGGTLVTSGALSCSSDASVIVGYGTDATGRKAVIWSDGLGIRSLQDVLVNEHGLGNALDGWTLTEATGVSADGIWIVGRAVNPEGRNEAFIAAVPEPACLSLLAVAALALGRGRRRA